MQRSNNIVRINRSSLRLIGIITTIISLVMMYFLKFEGAALFGVGATFVILSLANFDNQLYTIPRNNIQRRYR